MENTSAKRILSDRISKEQKRKMIEIMHQYPDIARGLTRSNDNVERTWMQITKILNNINGSKKKPAQWRRSWIDYKALVKRQFAALVAYNNGTWTKEEPPRVIDKMDIEVAQFISNLPPECLEYDVHELNEIVKLKLAKNVDKSVSNNNDHSMEYPTDAFPHYDDDFNCDVTIKEENDEDDMDDDDFYTSQHSSSVKYNNNEFHINFLEESAGGNTNHSNISEPPPLYPITHMSLKNNRPAGVNGVSCSSRSEHLLEQLLMEQRKTNELLAKTLKLLEKRK